MPRAPRKVQKDFTYRKFTCEWNLVTLNWVVKTPEGHTLMHSSDKDGIKSYIDDYVEAYYEGNTRK
jgi:hypothetical protein